MELIFEIIDESGRRHQYRKLCGEWLTVGRAWDNDLVLTDPAVNPHHAVIEMDDNNQLTITDLDSLNGTNIRRKQRISGTTKLLAGEEYLLGKTRVYIYTPDHPVAETVMVADMDNKVRLLDDMGLLIGAIIMVALLYAGEQWLNMFSGFKWQDVTNILLVIFGGALGLTLFWSVIGRVVRHETQFRKQLSLILIMILVQFVLSKLFALLMFNTLSFTLGMVMLILTEFILLTATFWFNLYLATNQSTGQRTLIAVVLAGAMIALSFYSDYAARSEFTEYPDYVKILAPPALHFGSGVSEDEFLAGTAEVFSRLDEE